MNLHDFFVSRKKEDNYVNEIIKNYLENKANIYSYQKKSELLKKVIELFTDQSKKLMSLNFMKDRVLGIISHELKNSINIIQNYAEYILNLKKNKIDKDVELGLKIIFNTAINTTLLLDNILDFSSIQSGNVKIFIDSFNVIDLVENIIIANSALLDFKKLNIVFNKTSNKLIVKSDKYKLYQIFSNILSNAIKYTPEGKNIYVKVENDDYFVYISIKDEGQGIPEDKIDKLFIPYSKVFSKPTGKERSTGLGLFITKYLADAIKCKIDVKSKVGEGSVFTLIIPFDYKE
ncbi:MAG TPA: HAMP domain-containing sensor histidine kinase [Spirochaetota bacterium]|nr:HAMP domain-containing sensor histidine kinase [Spirochaetota bacterium]HOM38611.1 HAMP domain-containing sensor histidine kinase [Spirochaetota bacterium]HPQ49748.1 HAMP domain-containing sensor histidine kinase [Spirochaetota bacterium]